MTEGHVMKFKKLECSRCVAGGVSVIGTKLRISTQLEPLGLHTLDVLYFKQINYMKCIFFEQLIGHKCFHNGVKERHFIVWINFRTAKRPHQLITVVVKKRMHV